MENTRIYEDLANTYNRYPKSFRKAGVDFSALCTLEQKYRIVETITNFEKGEEQPTKAKEISTQYYANTLTWIQCMGDRVYKKVVSGCGVIAYKLISRNPYEEGTKTIRTYEFIRKEVA